MSVHVVVHGRGCPLVLFHGWGFDVRIWHSLLPRLTTQYQLYLVDLPGFGLTPSMAWDSFQEVLLEQLPPRFALAGWSMGGLCATRLAIDAPTRVSHLVNIASSPRFIRDKGWPGVDGKIFRAFYHELAYNPQQTLEAFIQLQLHGQSMTLGYTPSIDGLKSGLDLLVNWDLREYLTCLTIPVLYIFGRLDTITPRKTMATMQAMYPHFDYKMLATAAHAPFLSNPDEFITVLEGFVQ
jgi:pimeloyl-[acyl-carrier protein] methyl ester esterase